MESWPELCRSCLSPEATLWLLDESTNAKEKFFEITSIQVSPDDGLPQKLCNNCEEVMNSAYEFRTHCMKIHTELTLQMENLTRQSKGEGNPQLKITSINEDITENELMSIIKQEPSDNEDDCYYVLVIDDEKQKGNGEEEKNVNYAITEVVDNIKMENQEHVEYQESEGHEEHEEQQSHDQTEVTDDQGQQAFEDTYNSFLNTTKVSANVPANILENEDDNAEAEMYEFDIEEMNADESQDTQDSTSQDVTQVEDSQDQQLQIALPKDIHDGENKNLIKIISATNTDGTIVLKGENGVQYLANSQLVEGADGELNQQEVILCEGDESSQFQILKCDGSELVIEYAGNDQIATVLQQEDGTFLCDCGEEFDDLAEYEKHQHKHNPAGDHLCNLCGKGFESAEILTGHMLLHSVSGVLVLCPFCNQLIRRNALTQHIKYGHNNMKPQCKICHKTFANPNNLKRHVMIHSGIKEFECDICNKRFHQKITMQTHRLTHMNPFSCNQCDETFENQQALANHKQSNECTQSKVKKVKEELMKTVKQEITTSLGKLLGYACSICKKMFSLESALELHVETTHIVDPSELLCSECGEVIPSRKEMQSHKMTHKHFKQRNAKRFECQICGKGCSSQAMLLMHERVHTNERPFPCALCSLKFKTKTHLRTHQLTHTREKKFGCSICMKFFALKGNLVVHLRTHTGERPYVCTICGEAFIDSKYLKKHKVKKHAIENVPWNQY